MEKDDKDIPISILLVGEKLTGKTQLFWRYVDGIYDETLVRPVGVEFKRKIVTSLATNKEYKVHLWDPDRPARFSQPRTQTYYKRIMGMVFVLDLTNRESINFLRNELRLATELGTAHIQKILVGTKSDDAANRQISQQEAQELVESFNMPYFEVSARTDQNVTQAFTALISMIEPLLHHWTTPEPVAPTNNTGFRFCTLL